MDAEICTICNKRAPASDESTVSLSQKLCATVNIASQFSRISSQVTECEILDNYYIRDWINLTGEKSTAEKCT